MAQLLLIEPDSLLSQTYARVLAAAGHIVKCAHSAQQAVDSADETRPDLVILELQLTAHNGIEFLYEFRSYAEWLQVPVIILSLVPPQEFLTNSLNWQLLGVGDYLYKPCTSLRQLLAAVNEQLTVTA